MSRAGSLASDWFYLGRVRPIDEISDSLDALTERLGRRVRAGQPDGRDDHPDTRPDPFETAGIKPGEDFHRQGQPR